MTHCSGLVGEHGELQGPRLLVRVPQGLEYPGRSRVRIGPHVAIIPGGHPQAKIIGFVVAIGVAHPAQSVGAVVEGYCMDRVARRSVHVLPFRRDQLTVFADIFVIRTRVAMAARLWIKVRHGPVLQSPLELDADRGNVFFPRRGQVVVLLDAYQSLGDEGQRLQFLFQCRSVDLQLERVVLAPRLLGGIQNPWRGAACETSPTTFGRHMMYE
mmetsp:Transcript_1082/g.2426  ORF Transcript_1082/g.2426 Transcript_1082/m.2426 type:complete len:213 (+) Transcript_1082:744-1382(+)